MVRAGETTARPDSASEYEHHQSGPLAMGTDCLAYMEVETNSALLDW